MGAMAYLQVSPLKSSRDETRWGLGLGKRSVSWNLPKLSQLWWCKGGFRPSATQNLRTKQLVSGARNSSRVAACALRNEKDGRCRRPRLSSICNRYPFARRRLRRMRQILDGGIYNSQIARCWLLRARDKSFSHTIDSLGRWPRPGCSFRSAQAATLMEFIVVFTNCFVRRWFCVVLGPKSPLHGHNWRSFDKFQDTEFFLIPCPRHVSSRLLPSGSTCKYAIAPIIQINLERFCTYWYAPLCCISLGCWAAEFEISGEMYKLLCIW
jgi:hypothetical protein